VLGLAGNPPSVNVLLQHPLTLPPPREYVKQGAKFAKWRAALKVAEGSCPSDLAVSVNAEQLAEYAAICQVRCDPPLVTRRSELRD
jgi:hypothetical protein